MDAAKRLVCNERSEHHGETSSSFSYIAEFWSTYLAMTHKTDIKVTREDVAQMLSLLKKVRHSMGDKMNAENFVDDIGYVSIAGMFAGIKPIQAAAEPDPQRYGQGTRAEPTTALVQRLNTRSDATRAVSEALQTEG